MLDLHLHQALLRFLTAHEIDSPVCKVGSKIRVYALLVACITVDIGGAISSYRSEFDCYSVRRQIGMRKSM